MKFEAYQNPTTHKWDFRIWASNGNILTSTRQGYENKQDCLDVIKAIQGGAAGAMVVIGNIDPEWMRTQRPKGGSVDAQIARANESQVQAGESLEKTTSNAAPIRKEPEVVERAMDAGAADKPGDIRPLEDDPKPQPEAVRDYEAENSRGSRPAPKAKSRKGLFGRGNTE
jgi:uncharacterized protein YegP (UPF0339 family)